MKIPPLLLLVPFLGFGLLVSSPAEIESTGSGLAPAEAEELLAFHNRARAEVGTPALQWSPEISRHAQEWADHIAATGKLAHRAARDRRYGENLAANQSVLAGAKMWYAEKKLYRAGTNFSMRLMPASHYTQMVWRGTTHVGAGKAVIRKGPYRGLVVLVCNYAPPGNVIGRRPY